ncbi:hypothetical protein Agub_g8463, partial [Astrephomene gubernaculifera]
QELGVWRRHEPLGLLRRGLAEEPGEGAQRAAQALLSCPPPDPDADLRQDLTHLRVFTIDDASTTEVDDGISIEPWVTTHEDEDGEGDEGSGSGSSSRWSADGGVLKIWIHVADPSRWIQPGSDLDLYGSQRLRSLYLPWGNLPMFPRSLAEGPFSLREGQVCDAFSICVLLRPDGSLTRPRVTPSRITVTHKLTYEAADSLIAPATAATTTRNTAPQSQQQQQQVTDAAASSPKTTPDTEATEDNVSRQQQRPQQPDQQQQQQQQVDGEALADLLALHAAATARRSYREARGAIEIPSPEARVTVPASHLDRVRPGVRVAALRPWESAARGLVAEMMILAGEAVGELGSSACLPLPYRSQPAPPHLPPPTLLAALPEGPVRGFALRRCMPRSAVGPEPLPHAALGLEAYVQVTSPIRRYPDLLAHHNLKAWLRGRPLPYGAPQIEAAAEAAAGAGRELTAVERECENYWVAEYFRQHWGSDYPATLLGWQREELRLAAFLIDELGLEVVARLPPGCAG